MSIVYLCSSFSLAMLTELPAYITVEPLTDEQAAQAISLANVRGWRWISP